MSESKGNGSEKCLCERCYMFKTLLIKYWDKELNQTKKKNKVGSRINDNTYSMINSKENKSKKPL